MTAVLVAEDDPAQLQGITAFLRHAGFQVYPASNGDEALAVGGQVKPDAAICDWDLGEGPDGAFVVLQLQSNNPQLVPILVTGNDVSTLKSRSLDVRDATYFAKPITPERLLEALKSAGCSPTVHVSCS